MKRIAVCFLFAVAAALLSLNVFAEEPSPAEAEELTISLSCPGVDTGHILDRNETSYTKLPSVTLSSDSPVYSLYIEFDRIFGEWSLSDGSVSVVCGKDGFLHEYVDVASAFGYAPKKLTLTFTGAEASVSEIYAFGNGELPSWVQVWEPPCERADLVLFSTHVDDEQLFFAGILPYYAGERKLAVEVVYFTTPFTYHNRQHEQLNGLWTVGVRSYPISGEFIDAYSESAKKAYSDQEQYGFSRDDMVLFQVEMIRRFRPHVIVGHDINGEYSHGQHIINCETLMEALPLAADETFDPDSAAKFGVWDTPKTYIHLWKENEIVMDWDTPLEAFGGKTAFEVTQEGFLCHKSQQWTWFRNWIFGKNNTIKKASQIKSYSPCKYGLYRSTVGTDKNGGDMFENIPLSYAEIKAEEERQALLESAAESERISLEESRIESALLAEEESRRAESEAEANRGTLPPEEPSETGEDDDDKTRPATGVFIVAASAVLGAALIIPQITSGKKKKRK